MGGCAASSLKIPSEKKFRRAIKLYEVTEVSSLTNLFNRNKCFEGGETPLTLAAQEGHEAIVQALVKHGADVNMVDRNGRCPLHLATQLNDVETVDILLRHKANPSKYDEYNATTPLHIASERGYTSIVEKLLEAGAKANESDHTLPPLVYSVLHKNVESSQMLIHYGADPNVTDGRGNTLLRIAVSNGDAAMVELLLQNKADPDADSRDDDTLVCLATLNDSAQVLETLVRYKCAVDDHNTDEPPALVVAVVRGNIETVEILLNGGANVNINDKRRQNVMQVACMSIADTEKLSFYSRYFSNVYRMYSKYDPEEVNQENRCKVVMSLVQAGADVTRAWERFSQIFPDTNNDITFEQLVLCEVLIQAYGFHQLSKVKLNNFIARVIDKKEYGLIRLLYSSGIQPSYDTLATLAVSPDEETKGMFFWVKNLLSKPRQLKDLCRQQIRAMLSWNVLFLVDQLQVSNEIKEYICIMDTECYSLVET